MTRQGLSKENRKKKSSNTSQRLSVSKTPPRNKGIGAEYTTLTSSTMTWGANRQGQPNARVLLNLSSSGPAKFSTERTWLCCRTVVQSLLKPTKNQLISICSMVLQRIFQSIYITIILALSKYIKYALNGQKLCFLGCFCPSAQQSNQQCTGSSLQARQGGVKVLSNAGARHHSTEPNNLSTLDNL